MGDDPGGDILDGIKHYLREHFPGSEIVELDEAATGSVILHGTGELRYRLEVRTWPMASRLPLPNHLTRC